MDRTDYQILNILQADCRVTLKHIGDQVGLTAPAVSERIRRMEEKGVIRNFRIDVDRSRLDCGMTGFILVALEPEKYNSFCEFCRKNPAVIGHYHVIGVFNALLRFAVRGTLELDALLSEIKRYGDSQTSVELKTYFEVKDIPYPAD
jgi:Lrp/AsnC family leucine-responsive transcriptional regulator